MRLVGVTQVAAASEVPVFHNRLTHSLKVAQIGRRLAQRLRKQQPDQLNPDVVEAAALIHDLGHPPFGHVGEVALARKVAGGEEKEGYEGNAQSFRIVTKLEAKSLSLDGLDLTRAVLNASLKYPTYFDPHGKWGAYRSEKDDFEFARAKTTQGMPSLEAQIMDVSDDIAYATHDLEDFYRVGMIPLDRLCRTEEEEADLFLDGAHERLNGAYTPDQLRTSFTVLTAFFMKRPFRGYIADQAEVREMTSRLIRRFDQSVQLTSDNLSVIVDPDIKLEQVLLKQLIWHYVIENPALSTLQKGQRLVVEELFDVYLASATRRKDWKLFPQAYQDRLDQAKSEAEYPRLVADFVSGLTERQATQLHARLKGLSPGNILDGLF